MQMHGVVFTFCFFLQVALFVLKASSSVAMVLASKTASSVTQYATVVMAVMRLAAPQVIQI